MMITLTPKMRWSPWTAPRRTQAGSAAGFIEENVLLKEKKKKEKSIKMGGRKQIFAFAERPLPCSVLVAPLNPAANTCKTQHV